MSIALKNELRLAIERIEKLERIVNQLNPEPRVVAGQSDPDPEQSKKRGPKPKSK